MSGHTLRVIVPSAIGFCILNLRADKAVLACLCHLGLFGLINSAFEGDRFSERMEVLDVYERLRPHTVQVVVFAECLGDDKILRRPLREPSMQWI